MWPITIYSICYISVFLDFVHLENPLFKVIFGLVLRPPVCLSLIVVLRGNLSYDKTVLLNKVACTLEHYYWHIGVSLSRILFIITIYCYVICVCLSFLGMGV